MIFMIEVARKVSYSYFMFNQCTHQLVISQAAVTAANTAVPAASEFHLAHLHLLRVSAH